MQMVHQLAVFRFTYEIAPVYILMEKEVMRKMWEMVGWEGEADGIFAPGGAMANLYALNAARHHIFPRVKPLGSAGVPTLCAFTSEDVSDASKGVAIMRNNANCRVTIPSEVQLV